MSNPPVYVAKLGLHTVPFADRAHAEQVAQQWNTDHAKQVAYLREEGSNRLADDLVASIEEWDHDRWAWTGPGGMAAVWTRVPDRRYVHSLWHSYGPTGKTINESGLYSRWAWEFETDSYSTRDAQYVVDQRPGVHAITEVRACGTNRAAVEAAFVKGKEEALRTCGDHYELSYRTEQ